MLTLALILASTATAGARYDLGILKAGWRQRLAEVRFERIPLWDLESSADPSKLDAAPFVARLDALGVAVMALSPERSVPGEPETLPEEAAQRLAQTYPTRFLPVTSGGGAPPWPKQPEAYVDRLLAQASLAGTPLLGEFEFRHYPSVRHLAHNQEGRDVTVPVNGPAAHRLFEFSQRTGIPFEIHYEIEDALLPPLEAMLTQYPKAKVVWAHFGHVRYGERAGRFTPDFVRGLLSAHPNLHFDLAVASSSAVYQASGQKYSRIWDPSTGKLDPRWRTVIADNPWRFHSALDLGGDRLGELEKRVARQRFLLEQLPAEIREIVAFKASWKLLFDEDFEAPLIDTAPLRVGYFLGGRTSIVMRLKEYGEFARRGVQVQLLTRKLRDDHYHVLERALLDADKENSESKATGVELTAGVLEGRWDLATIGESSFLAAAAVGQPIVAVAELGHDVAGQAGHLFALRKGLKASAPADYKGMLLVSRRAGPGDAAFLLEYLASQGVDLKRDAVEISALPKTLEERRRLPTDKVLLVHGVYEDDLTNGVVQGLIDGGFFHLKPFEALSHYLTAVKPLHEWANPELSQAVLICRKDFLEVPLNQARLKAFLLAYLGRADYERSLPQVERKRRRQQHWRSLDSATTGYNYPQYDSVPVVDVGLLAEMAQLLRKHHLVDWKDFDLKSHIDNRWIEQAAATLRSERTQ